MGSGAVSAAAASTEMSCHAVHCLVTASLAVQNRRFSMFHRVSTLSRPDSPLAAATPAAEALSATVTLPSAFFVTV